MNKINFTLTYNRRTFTRRMWEQGQISLYGHVNDIFIPRHYSVFYHRFISDLMVLRGKVLAKSLLDL